MRSLLVFKDKKYYVSVCCGKCTDGVICSPTYFPLYGYYENADLYENKEVEYETVLVNPVGRIVDPNDICQNHSECVWKAKVFWPEEKQIWQKELDKVKQCPQRQDSLADQLADLRVIANKFGLYDAADYLRRD